MRAVWLGVLALGGLGCGAGAYACTDDASCRDGDRVGTCEPTGGCSFPDPACGSGRRYGAHAPNGLAGECVVDEVAGTASSDGGGTTTLAPTTTTDDATTGDRGSSEAGTTLAVDGSGDESSSDQGTSGTSLDSGPITDSQGTSESGGPDPGGDPYGSCMREACTGSSECSPVGALPQTCAPPCDGDGDCPPALDATFVPVCEGSQGEHWCVLPCTEDTGCPDGMQCTAWQEQQFGFVCTWF